MASKDIEEKRCAAIDLLCPVSVGLLKNPTPQNAKAFILAVSQVDTNIIQDLQSYIIYPLETGLKNKMLSEASMISLCDALRVVLKKSRVQSFKTFFELHVRLLGLFDVVKSTPGNGGCKQGSEEGDIVKIKSIMSLLDAANEEVLSEFYCFQNLPMIAQTVTYLLNIINKDQSKQLKILALECILLYMQTESEFGRNHAVQLGDFFSHCFPGIFSCMFSVANSSVSTQGQAILAKSLAVCSQLVTLTLSDGLLACSQDQQLRRKSDGIEPHGDLPKALKEVYCERNQAWVSRVVTNASPMLRSFCNLASHSHWRVRLAVVEFAENILMSCSSSLSCCVPHFLEALVGLIHDSYEGVAKKAVAALQAFKSSQADTQGERTLLHILEDNLYDLATVLPRQMKFYDEDKKPHLIKLLLGYISLLGPSISGFVSSAPHIKRVCLVLIQILELDVTNVNILEERGSLLHSEPEVFTEPNSTKIWRPRKYFRHFREEAIFSELMNVCRQLGKFGNIYILVDQMLELYQESDQYKLAAVLIINEMMTGAAIPGEGAHQVNDQQLLKDVIKLLLEEYLSPANIKLVDVSNDRTHSSHQSSLHLATSCTSLVVSRPSESQLWKNPSLANRNRAILLSCLFMEGVGKFATALGRDFQVHLINGLYPLVENLGHENVHISSTSYSALVEVALACGYRSLDQLIQGNVDYLVRSVSRRLRHFDQYLRSPQTICVMLRYCSQDLLFLIDHSVAQMLETLDDNYTEHLILFMPVLVELVKAIGRWFPPEKKTKRVEPTRVRPSGKIDVDQLLAEINEYAKNKQIAECDLTDESFCDNDDEETRDGKERTLEDIEEDMKRLMAGQDGVRGGQEKEDDEQMKEGDDEGKKRDPPKHVVIVKEVFKRIKNLMSYHEPSLRVLALDVISYGCQDLMDYERELLPQIHQLWPGLACLFHHQEKFVVIKAMQTLLALTNLSGDFIRSRVMKEVVPGVVQYMEKQGNISSESRSAYLHTTNYKLQLCVLSTLGPLAKNLALDGNDLNTLVNICLPYLSDLQPLPLQNAAVESFSMFIDLDPDALWYTLCEVYCPVMLTPPGSEFLSISFPYGPNKQNRFSTKITEIFNEHFL